MNLELALLAYIETIKLINLIMEGIPIEERQKNYMQMQEDLKPLRDWIEKLVKASNDELQGKVDKQ